MTKTDENALKYVVVGLIWIGAFILAGLMILTGALSSGGANFLMGGALFVATGLATGAMFNWGQIDENAHKREAEDAGKAKNDQRSIDPLSLLTDDDIAELREDIKRSLRLRLLQGQDGELGSLDALLAERDQRARRK